MILIVDDEIHNLEALRITFIQKKMEFECFQNPLEALKFLEHNSVQLVLTDFKMLEMDGLQFLQNIKKISPETEVILMTAYATVEKAVEAMKLGAYDFLTKPLKRPLLLNAVEKAIAQQKMARENLKLKAKQEILEQENLPEILGESKAIQAVKNFIQLTAHTRANIFITGESGVGKTHFARLIHYKAFGEMNRFVSINCASLPENLLESELFGYEPGAFTDAKSLKLGRIELADAGSFFFDEIAELSISMQAKILRVVQEGQFERLGSTKTQTVNVRWLAATHADPQSLIAQKLLRQDLFFRLNVLSLHIPALRERKEDIPCLVQAAIKKAAQKNKIPVKNCHADLMASFYHYDWPGNVRELENTIEKLLILGLIDADLPIWALSMFPFYTPEEMEKTLKKPALQENLDLSQDFFHYPLGRSLDELEESYLEATLEMCDGDKRKAAAILGVNVRTIYRRQNPHQDHTL